MNTNIEPDQCESVLGFTLHQEPQLSADKINAKLDSWQENIVGDDDELLLDALIAALRVAMKGLRDPLRNPKEYLEAIAEKLGVKE